jgi:hypothetical protein
VNISCTNDTVSSDQGVDGRPLLRASSPNLWSEASNDNSCLSPNGLWNFFPSPYTPPAHQPVNSTPHSVQQSSLVSEQPAIFLPLRMLPLLANADTIDARIIRSSFVKHARARAHTHTHTHTHIYIYIYIYIYIHVNFIMFALISHNL